jgi:hypothetical protein
MNRMLASELGGHVAVFSAMDSDTKPYSVTDNNRWNAVNTRWVSKTSKFLLRKISASVLIHTHVFTSKYVKKKISLYDIQIIE